VVRYGVVVCDVVWCVIAVIFVVTVVDVVAIVVDVAVLVVVAVVLVVAAVCGVSVFLFCFFWLRTFQLAKAADASCRWGAAHHTVHSTTR
jgi:hypothetical protein